jgi:hypothetical protein
MEVEEDARSRKLGEVEGKKFLMSLIRSAGG